MGSVTEAERLWSVAARVRAVHRKNTTQIIFEALLFLNFNQEYWDLHTVKEAMRSNASRKTERRIEEDEELENDME